MIWNDGLRAGRNERIPWFLSVLLAGVWRVRVWFCLIPHSLVGDGRWLNIRRNE